MAGALWAPPLLPVEAKTGWRRGRLGHPQWAGERAKGLRNGQRGAGKVIKYKRNEPLVHDGSPGQDGREGGSPLPGYLVPRLLFTRLQGFMSGSRSLRRGQTQTGWRRENRPLHGPLQPYDSGQRVWCELGDSGSHSQARTGRTLMSSAGMTGFSSGEFPRNRPLRASLIPEGREE